MIPRKRADAGTTRLLPKPPIVVNASGTFDGNDGKWSTFIINVNSDIEGLNGQNFKALISTSSPVTLLPARTGWCNQECAERRGVLPIGGRQPYGVEESNWQPYGNYEIPLPRWYSTVVPGNAPNGSWGRSNVGLGESSKDSPVSLERYVVKHTIDNFFLSWFGLAVGATGEEGSTRATFLSSLEDDNSVPSSSYGYTAGAYYRKNALGSLVLGGYDRSRMTDRNVSISMQNTKNTKLTVGVQSIIYAPDQNIDTGENSMNLQSGGFLADIDSTLPYLVLPSSVCQEFQRRFRLGHDEDRDLYTVNASSHAANVQQNAIVRFKIGSGANGGDEYTNIELPYAAFYQQMGTRTGENMTTNYFPIKQSKDESHVLGRTFLQEAYLVVDYERGNFAVAPAHYSDPMPGASIVPIFNKTFSLNADLPIPSDGGLAPGAIAGIVVGIVVAFVVAGIVAFCCWRKRRSQRDTAQKHHETSQIDPALAGQEVIKYRRVSELTGSEIPTSPKTPLAGYYTVDHKSIPPISEMSPDSPPVELYSPPPESASDIDGGRDYFTAGKPHRRGAQRDRASSGHNTPGTPPIAELPGDEGQFHIPSDTVSPPDSPVHSRGPSDNPLSKNIDQRLADHKKHVTRPLHPAEAARDEAQPSDPTGTTKERRPSHHRGPSDTTIASESTAVSQPTNEEQERGARESGGQFSR